MIEIEIFSSAKTKWRLELQPILSFEQADELFKFTITTLPFKMVERIEGPDVLLFNITCNDVDIVMTYDAPNMTDIAITGSKAENTARNLAENLAKKYDGLVNDRSQEKHRKGVNPKTSFLTRLFRGS